MIGTLLAIGAGSVLWLCGAIVFDALHCVLHWMLRSPIGFVRTLARPHGVHHEWIDRNLTTDETLRSANVWCHIVPEFLTQLAFTLVVALVFSIAVAVVLAGLQTIVFLYILRDRGSDLNHRPIPRIDAHPSGWLTPPSYHLLHHVWPDSYFSAYTKVVDRIVGSACQIRERRFGWIGPQTRIAVALREQVERAGGISIGDPDESSDIDVLVLTDPSERLESRVEPFLHATRDRQLAPEVWAILTRPEDPTARYYIRDRRVVFRALLAESQHEAIDVGAEAKRALFWIRRDANLVLLGGTQRARTRRRFWRVAPVSPAGASEVRHRMQYIDTPAAS